MGNTKGSATDPGLLADKSANPERDLAPQPPPAEPGLPDEDDDNEIADLWRNRGFFDLDRIEAVQCDAAPGGWLPLVRPGQFVHPRSETAHILRVIDRREGTSHSLDLISYGPVELFLRKLLALLNWRRWWR